jgi:hypothetical protein
VAGIHRVSPHITTGPPASQCLASPRRRGYPDTTHLETAPVLFHDVTITATGDLRFRRTRDSATLRPAAVEFFRHLLDRHGEDFRVPLPVAGLEHIELSLTWAGTAALATFWSRGEPVTTSALMPGVDAEHDREALDGLQFLVMGLSGDSPTEPRFDLLSLTERPLLATVPIPAAPSPDMATIADAETCLAAAYFLAVFGGD